MSKPTDFKHAKQILKTANCRMDLDNQTAEELVYDTREYGNVLEEEPGERDIIHAKAMAGILRQAGYNAHVDWVDEWTILIVNLRQ